MDLRKSRQSTNVVDARNVSKTMRNTRLRSPSRIKDDLDRPTSYQDVIKKTLSNPGIVNDKISKKPGVKDPKPKKLQRPAAKKTSRIGSQSRKQRAS